MDQLYEFGGGGSGSNDSVMQYGSAAGVCNPRDDIRDISRANLEKTSDGLFGVEVLGGGSWWGDA